MLTKIVNIQHDTYDVYVGRGSKWGNPFKIGVDGTRNEVIEKYEKFLTEVFINEIKNELVGKTLGCYCKPKKCHGDILVKVANSKRLVLL